MSGDKFIDSPSLKAADVAVSRIGCMSQTVKSISGMMMQDMSFKNMIEMIKKCRKVVNNVKNILICGYVFYFCQIIFLIILFLSKRSVFIEPLYVIFINTTCAGIIFILLMLMYKREDYIIKPNTSYKIF